MHGLLALWWGVQIGNFRYVRFFLLGIAKHQPVLVIHRRQISDATKSGDDDIRHRLALRRKAHPELPAIPRPEPGQCLG